MVNTPADYAHDYWGGKSGRVPDNIQRKFRKYINRGSKIQGPLLGMAREGAFQDELLDAKKSWLDNCRKKIGGHNCWDMWDNPDRYPGLTTVPGWLNHPDLINSIDERIKMDPLMYTDDENQIIREYANKLIQGE